MRRYSRSDLSTRAQVAKYAKILVEQVVCEVVRPNGERYPPNSLYLLIVAINRYLSETGEKDAN